MMLSWYNTPKARKIQPDNGLKRAETCSCIIYCTIQCNQICWVLTASYTYSINSIEHNGDVAPRRVTTFSGTSNRAIIPHTVQRHATVLQRRSNH